MNSEFKPRIIKCFRAAFPNIDENDIESAKMADLEGWDSLASVILISVVEEEFQIQVEDEALEKFDSFKGVSDWVSASFR